MSVDFYEFVYCWAVYFSVFEDIFDGVAEFVFDCLESVERVLFAAWGGWHTVFSLF